MQRGGPQGIEGMVGRDAGVAVGGSGADGARTRGSTWLCEINHREGAMIAMGYFASYASLAVNLLDGQDVGGIALQIFIIGK